MPRSIDCYHKYGMLPSNLHAKLVNDWDISFYREYLEKHYLLYWEPRYTSDRIINGCIENQGNEYLVVYHKCTSNSLWQCNQIALSFRKAIPEFAIPSYVLLSKGNRPPWTQQTHFTMHQD